MHEDELISLTPAESSPSSEAPLAVSSPVPDLSPSGLPTANYLGGATLTSLDSFSMLKRKRGRPPKNKIDAPREPPIALLDRASSSPETLQYRLNSNNNSNHPFGSPS